MDETNRDGWLIAVGLAYPVVAYGLLLGCGGAMGPLAFHPIAIPLPAVVLVAIAVGLRMQGVRLRWWAIALFLAWLYACVYAQWLVYAKAAASV